MLLGKMIEKDFKYRDVRCVIVFDKDYFYRCGYVVLDHKPSQEAMDDFKCNGGVTFEGWGFNVINAPSEKFVIGFDCNHCWDVPDMLAGEEYLGKEQFEKIMEQRGDYFQCMLMPDMFETKSLHSLNDCIFDLKSMVDCLYKEGDIYE
ncbi:MAG: hypothetical protein Q4E88_02905 [Coriobacteriia bacterium]|nr:hypothetical protein [Coriobacteriia bacterium]